jgi:DNA-directed RNA polymerase subunit RPC12/RpoP
MSETKVTCTRCGAVDYYYEVNWCRMFDDSGTSYSVMVEYHCLDCNEEFRIEYPVVNLFEDE